MAYDDNKSFDYDYHDRLGYLADLIEAQPESIWYHLSREALDMYPVSSQGLQQLYMSFPYFEKAVQITLLRMGL